MNDVNMPYKNNVMLIHLFVYMVGKANIMQKVHDESCFIVIWTEKHAFLPFHIETMVNSMRRKHILCSLLYAKKKYNLNTFCSFYRKANLVFPDKLHCAKNCGKLDTAQ